MTDVFAVQLEADSSGIRRAKGDVDKLGRSGARAQSSLQKFGQQARRTTNTLGKMGIAAGAASFALGVEFTRRGLDFVDSQAKTARSLDSTIDGLRAVQIAAGDAGVDFAQISEQLQRMGPFLVEAARGEGRAAEELARLNLNAQELLDMDVDQRMATIADAVERFGLSSAETQQLLRGLGVRQREVALLVQNGSEAFRDARQEVDDFGLSISQVDASAVERANDAMSRIGRTTEALQTSLAIAAAPFVEFLSDELNNATREADGFKTEIQDGIESTIQGFGFVLDAVEGVKRVFQIAGNAQVAVFIDMQLAALKLADTLINGPIDALNKAIELSNRFLGTDFEQVALTGIGRRVEGQIATLEDAQGQALDAVSDLVNKSFPSDGLDDALGKVRELSRSATAASEATAFASSSQRRGADSGAPETGQAANDEAFTVEKLQELEDVSISTADRIERAFADQTGSAIEQMFIEGEISASNFAESVLRDLQRILAQALIIQPLMAGLFGAAGGGAAGSAGLFGNVFSALPGFATGGSFNVGGSGGTDSQLVAFRASPNERVSVRTPAQQSEQGQVVVNIDARGADAGVEARVRALAQQEIIPQAIRGATDNTLRRLNRPRFA